MLNRFDINATIVQTIVAGKENHWLVFTLNTKRTTRRMNPELRRCTVVTLACKSLLSLSNEDGALIIHDDDLDTVIRIAKTRRLPSLDWNGEIRIKLLSFAPSGVIGEKLRCLIRSIRYEDEKNEVVPPITHKPGIVSCVCRLPEFRKTGT